MVTTDPAAQSGRPQAPKPRQVHRPPPRRPPAEPAPRKASPVDLPIRPSWAGWR
jgi:hypothetical protein